MAYENKPNKGNLWINKYKKPEDDQPNLRGSVFFDRALLEDMLQKETNNLVEIALSGWNGRTGAGDPFISLKASEPYKKDQQQQAPKTEEKQPWEV